MIGAPMHRLVGSVLIVELVDGFNDVLPCKHFTAPKQDASTLGGEQSHRILARLIPAYLSVGYCPHPVTIYTKGHIKGCFYIL